MRLIYINNKYNKEDNDFLEEVKQNINNVETIDFMQARKYVNFRATPSIAILHDDLELSENNISCLLDSPTIEDIEIALKQDYPYPEPLEPSSPELTNLELLGQEVVMSKLLNIQKDNTINTLGQELTNIKLQLL